MIIALKKIRDDKNVSVPELVEMTGLSKTQIWNYESGRRQPDPESLCLLADALNVSLDMLVRGKEKDHSEEWSMESAISRFDAMSPAQLRELSALIEYMRYRKERELSEDQASKDTP